MSVSRLEKEHGRREDILRQEISDVQQVLTLCPAVLSVLVSNIIQDCRHLA